MSRNIYFASDKAEITVASLNEKAKSWFTGISQSSYSDKIEKSWRAYYGDYYGDNSAHELSFGGESGEIVNLAVNHFRNLAEHIHGMVTGSRPALQCRAVNTDKKSLIQAKLGNGLLDYYMREMRLEEVLNDAVEYAIVLGSGYVKLEWNSTRGKIHDYIEPDPSSIAGQNEDGEPIDENGNIVEAFPIYEGDVEFGLVSPYDIIFDSTKPYFAKNDWVVVRTSKNKFDLAHKYNELADEIIETTTVDKVQKGTGSNPYSKANETDDIFIYEFFHKRTESMPNGRYLLYVNDEIILEDSVMPYRDLPVYRITPSNIIGTPYGYTNMFDLLPLQEFLNSMYSTAASNINAFGLQSILCPREAGVEFEQVGNGMQFIKYNAMAGGGKPEPMQLTATSPEVYQMANILEKAMETLSGVNSVARGNPEQSLRSGNALALVQAQALQFVNKLENSYVRLMEDVGTGVINLLKDFASTPRVAAITGIGNATHNKEFKSDDISSINRVVVDRGNPLMNSAAGRTQVAENLLQMGLITNIDDYLMVLNTGNLNVATDAKFDNSVLIISENEGMMKGEVQQAIWSEKHSQHIMKHMEVLNDSELKKDPDLVQLVLEHVQEHVNLLRTTDPILLSFIGETPAAPAPTPQNIGQQGQRQDNMPDGAENAPMQTPPQTQPDGLPSLPQPAGVADGTLPPMPQKPEDL
jgi:hypothetical protein